MRQITDAACPLGEKDSTLEVRSSLVHKLAGSEMSRVTRNGFDRLRASCAMASHKSFLESPNPLKTAAGSIEHLRINDRELASYHPLTALGFRAGGGNIQQAGSLDLSYLCTRDVARKFVVWIRCCVTFEDMGKTVRCEATHNAEAACAAVRVSSWSTWVLSDAQINLFVSRP